MPAIVPNSKDALADIINERWRQFNLINSKPDRWDCADPEVSSDRKLAILVEEVGEVAKAMIEGERPEDLRTELIHVAAVAVAWSEALPRDDG